MIVNGTPMRTKSPKRYLPGTRTRVFTGEETGVIKAADAASATVITNGYGEAPSEWATVSAMGAMSTAVAVFETKRLMSAVTTKSAREQQARLGLAEEVEQALRGEIHAAGFLQRGGKGHHAHDEDEARPLDGFVGAVERDAAREAEQQAGDERGERIRHPAGDHERDHDGEAASAYGARLRAGAT